MVGPSGRVVAADIQPAMVSRLKRRVEKAGLLNRVDVRVASQRSLGVADLQGSADFTLAFAVVDHPVIRSMQSALLAKG